MGYTISNKKYRYKSFLAKQFNLIDKKVNKAVSIKLVSFLQDLSDAIIKNSPEYTGSYLLNTRVYIPSRSGDPGDGALVGGGGSNTIANLDSVKKSLLNTGVPDKIVIVNDTSDDKGYGYFYHVEVIGWGGNMDSDNSKLRSKSHKQPYKVFEKSLKYAIARHPELVKSSGGSLS